MPLPLFDESFLRKLERLALLSRRASAGQLQGERRSPKRGQSVEFADFRPYVAGDDFRRIDWNAFARLERFFIKLFVEEEDLTVHFVIDTSRSMDWGEPNKLQYAVRAVGAIGYIALVSLDRVTVHSVNGTGNGTGPGAIGGGIDHLSAVRGKQQAITLFSFLLKLAQRQQNTAPAAITHSIVRQLGAYAASTRLVGPLILCSDLMDDDWMEGVNSLAGRGFEVTILHLLSPDETNPTINGDYKLIDSENNSAVDITADFEMIQRYRQGLLGWRDSWQKFCTARGIHYVPVETTLPLEELLFAWMRRQGVLR